MEIDLSQFHKVFFEESLEGLDDMEQALLGLQLDNIDDEAINTIFRAAHSIKGGSATFGFSELADFTHILETLLDEMREGKRPVTELAVDLFLKGVDCLRNLLDARENEKVPNLVEVQELSEQFHQMMDIESLDPTSEQTDTTETVTGECEWQINFVPEPHILQTGNEPLRIFRELETLGKLKAIACTDEIPLFEQLKPEHCYISWQLTLVSDTSESSIREVFEWIIDDCRLEIKTVPISQTVSVEAATNQGEASSKPTEITDNKVPVITDKKNMTVNSKQEIPTTPRNVKSASIRVDIDKVDSLINLVGELVITQSMLSELGNNFDASKVDRLKSGLEQLLQNTKELQESVMRVRMLPISNAFNRFPRVVRDMAQKLGKNIDLKITGEQTELDKTVMEQISDPLVHLVRNSLDHGLEMPQERLDNNKSATGTVFLNAYHQGGNIVIEVGDDGAGLNIKRIQEKAIEKGIISANEQLSESQVHDLLFEAGFSTAEAVTDISGRGVGMDVVRRNINSLGGSIEVESEEGQGSTFSIRLPLTLAILDGQLVKVGAETYIIPLISIIESLQVDEKQIKYVSGNIELYRLRNENIPIIRTYDEFSIKEANQNLKNALLVVVEGEGHKAALLVDDLLAQQQFVIKSLETNYKRVAGISGATILGDGTVALIVDVAGFIKANARKSQRDRIHAA